MKIFTIITLAIATITLTACAKEEPVTEPVMEEKPMDGKL